MALARIFLLISTWTLLLALLGGLLVRQTVTGVLRRPAPAGLKAVRLTPGGLRPLAAPSVAGGQSS